MPKRATPRRYAWVVGALCLALAASAELPCDCDGDQSLTVADLARMVSLILHCDGNPAGCEAVPTGCASGDTNATQRIEVTDVLVAVSSLLVGERSCPAARRIVSCGNGTVESEEECDDGGICVATSRAGQACTSDAECFASESDRYGVCDEGWRMGWRCSYDDPNACPGGRCVACRPVGGDGCAANCTVETTRITLPFALRTSSSLASSLRCPPSLNFSDGHLDAVCLASLDSTVEGTETLVLGKMRAGKIPVTVPAALFSSRATPFSTFACTCLRAPEFRTCGGVLPSTNRERRARTVLRASRLLRWIVRRRACLLAQPCTARAMQRAECSAAMVSIPSTCSFGKTHRAARHAGTSGPSPAVQEAC